MAQFQSGQAKPTKSGRKKGTPNKRTLDLEDSLQTYGLDVIGEIAEALPELCAEKRVQVLMDLMSYLYPKRKAIEVSNRGPSQEPQVIVTLPPNGREANINGTVDVFAKVHVA